MGAGLPAESAGNGARRRLANTHRIADLRPEAAVSLGEAVGEAGPTLESDWSSVEAGRAGGRTACSTQIDVHCGTDVSEAMAEEERLLEVENGSTS